MIKIDSICRLLALLVLCACQGLRACRLPFVYFFSSSSCSAPFSFSQKERKKKKKKRKKIRERTKYEKPYGKCRKAKKQMTTPRRGGGYSSIRGVVIVS